MKHLLDVNVLLAAIWQQHPDFPKADAWLVGRQVASFDGHIKHAAVEVIK